MTFSKVNFGMIVRCAKSVKELTVPLQWCHHNNHDYLLPYYNGNEKLKFCYSDIITNHEGSDRASTAQIDLSELNKYIATDSHELSEYFSGSTTGLVVNDYDEDIWTT